MSIPIEHAKAIVEACGLSGVIVIGIGDIEKQEKHITTYGATAADKVLTGLIGDAVQDVLAKSAEWQVHSDFRQEFDSGLFRECLDLLSIIRGRNDGSPHTVLQAERILNAAGRGVRSGG